MHSKFHLVRNNGGVIETKQLGYKVIAVDFDGCLCTSQWPEIGQPNRQLIRMLKTARSRGNKVILWTCREWKLLDDAVKWCEHQGLRFDAVNENLPEMNQLYGNDCRKIGADIYIDDKAMRVEYTEAESTFWDGLFENVAGRVDNN